MLRCCLKGKLMDKNVSCLTIIESDDHQKSADLAKSLSHSLSSCLYGMISSIIDCLLNKEEEKITSHVLEFYHHSLAVVKLHF
jgi:hypothetical protein